MSEIRGWGGGVSVGFGRNKKKKSGFGRNKLSDLIQILSGFGRNKPHIVSFSE